MNDPNLVTLSLSAFLAVLIVLSVLALVIRGLTIVFHPSAAPPPTPEAGGGDAAHEARSSVLDAALVAALEATLAQQHPGHRVTRIEESTMRRAS